MMVEATFTCADQHERVWFNSWCCPVCEIRESSIDEREIELFGTAEDKE